MSERTDHNEAMRLADALNKWARDYATTDYTDAMATKAAALIRKQATARALDTFAHNVMAAQARLEMVQLTNKLRNVEGQRDTLRAEVERLRKTDAEILACNYPDGEENGPTVAAPDFDLICFARQLGIRDTARKATQ